MIYNSEIGNRIEKTLQLKRGKTREILEKKTFKTR